MKVLLAGYQALSILRGGPRTQILETFRHLGENGVQAALFDPWKPLSRRDADCVHLFGANIGTYHLARELHALGMPTVVSPILFSTHSSAFVRTMRVAAELLQHRRKGFWHDYAIAAEICGWASRVVPNTGVEGGLVERGLGIGRSKIAVVPNGVADRFEGATPDEFVRAYGVRDFILNVGHIGHRRKNVLALIRALAEIHRPAVIIGRFISGAYGDACRAEAARHKHILLIDGIDHESTMLASAYAACDTFVLPSTFETPGIAALEAGLAGAKVVVTPYGGTREYFEDMAGYVDPASVRSIREGILAMLARTKDGRLKEHIRRNYLWSNVSRMTAEVYRSVVDGASRAS
jgi:glycosyltransferase involved in cell wall biosynthesis